MIKFFMMIGLPASGKSEQAKKLAAEYNAEIFSSDELRVEMFGDVNHQEDNNALFNELHKRIRECLASGKSAIYDACNINYKRRMEFLKSLNKISCEKIAVIMATPYEVCIERNSQRERNVPEHVIKRMYMNFNIPYWYEGWDDIQVIGPQCDYYNVEEVVNALAGYKQGNSHHTLTLGEHLWKAYEYYQMNYVDYPIEDDVNSMATILHDIGKPFCRTEVNARGINDGDSHYCNHHFISAYDSLFVNCINVNYPRTRQKSHCNAEKSIFNKKNEKCFMY